MQHRSQRRENLVLLVGLGIAAALAAWGAVARGDDGWSWDLVPEIGLGSTLLGHAEIAATLGLRVGQFPAGWGPVAGREFGLDALQSADTTALGGWVGLAEVQGVKLRLGVMAWVDERPKADVYLRTAVPFSW